MALVIDGTGDITGLVTGALPANVIGSGAVLQVASNNFNSSVSSSSSTLVDSGLIVSITPSSSTSKILVMYNLLLTGGTNNSMTSRTVLYRDSTAIRDIGGVFYDSVQYPTYIGSMDTCCIVDSPSTTSPITYKVQFCRNSYAGSYGGTVAAGYATGTPINACQITVMEIAG